MAANVAGWYVHLRHRIRQATSVEMNLYADEFHRHFHYSVERKGEEIWYNRVNMKEIMASSVDEFNNIHHAAATEAVDKILEDVDWGLFFEPHRDWIPGATLPNEIHAYDVCQREKRNRAGQGWSFDLTGEARRW
jgi:hypothetical protein